ncbi:MAG: SEC-C domain-containing protein [Chitinophagales bacterium]|nr:SEC-C domain-containing protein [Chitinophagales bacterium]
MEQKINIPKLNHTILEKIYFNKTLTNDELNNILSLPLESLIEDLRTTIHFCNSLFGSEVDFDEISYNLLLYALFILKEIEAKNQLDIVFDIIHWEDEKMDFWFGDTVCKYLWNIVYFFAYDDIHQLVALLKTEKEIDTFNKEEIALAIYQLYLKNEDKRTLISNYWTELLEFYANLDEDSNIIDHTYFAFFINYIANPNEQQKVLIKKLYDNNYIDYMVYGKYEDFLKVTEEERELVSVYKLNEDLIAFENRNSTENNFFYNNDDYFTKQEPFVRETKKIGRNELCPCGSGKNIKNVV